MLGNAQSRWTGAWIIRYSIRPVTATSTAPQKAARTDVRKALLTYSAAGTYAVVVAAAIRHHEPWADEAQAWLLARDASLMELWTHLLHYEGAPGLWQTLLHFLVALGLPYSSYGLISGVLGLAAVWLLLRYAPLPLYIRLLLPFTYYLCYQYAVVARSYALVAPLLFACAALYHQALKRAAAFTALLCLLAGISVHGVVISAAIALAAGWRVPRQWIGLGGAQRRRLLIGAAVYVVVLCVIIAASWPARDVGFAEHRGLDNLTWIRLADVGRETLAEAFTGEWITSALVLALSLPFLWEGGAAPMVLAVTAILWLFGVAVYTQVWHYGVVWLVWLFGIWIAASRRPLSRAAAAALLATIAVHGYWAFSAIHHDWDHAYSGSAAAAQYFKQNPPPPGGLYALGYHCTALQPYFSRNLFSDFQDGSPIAYWDWSNRNPAVKDAFALFRSRRREMILVGYREIPEKEYWAGVLPSLGYEPVRHFEGSVFWHDRILEPEAYDLYARHVLSSPLSSSLKMGDPSAAKQLLAGFYGVESGSWRWSAGHFAAVLGTPLGAARHGARVVLRLYIPQPQIDRLGAITLTAEAEGYPLAGRTFSQPGNYIYSADIPPEALQPDLTAVTFRFDKAASGSKTDARELGAIITALSLEPER
jgi:hypothetical protein